MRPYGEAALLTPEERYFSAAPWCYFMHQGAGTFAEALLFPPSTVPTPTAAAVRFLLL